MSKKQDMFLGLRQNCVTVAECVRSGREEAKP